jgi:hypothetical protein
MKFKFILKVCLISALMGLSFSSYAGNEGANAGDEVGLEFQASYYSALMEIGEKFADLDERIKKTDVFEIAASVQVVTVNEPLQVAIGEHMQDSVAINNSEKNLILVNRTRWNAIESIPVRKSLALHEILSMAGLESSALYPISSLYLSRIMSQEKN